MVFSRRRKCKNKPDSFCYVCGCHTLLRQRRNTSSFVKRAYKAYFRIPLGDRDKKWSSHIVCHNCEEMLRDWTKGKQKGLPFGVSMVCREPRDLFFFTIELLRSGHYNALAYCDLGCKISIKLYFLHSHLDEFPSNPVAVTDKQGEQLHQYLMTMEHRCQGRWDRNMMADYYWSIMRDCPEKVYKRRSDKRTNSCLNRAKFNFVFCLY